MALDHYVSQVHLKRFYAPALNGKKMYCFRKSDGLTFPCDARDVCRIPDGSTNSYLAEPRLIEDFLKLIEPKYNWACDLLVGGKIDPDGIFVIAGFAAFVAACSPTAMRMAVEPLKANVLITAELMDRMGQMPLTPPELGGRSISELIADSTVILDVDQKYPQAVGISNVFNTALAYGNFHWDILVNKHADAPFFTSDFPVAVERSSDPRLVNRVVPLTPALAIRIRPRLELDHKKLEPTFEHFSYTRRKLSRTEVVALNRTIVRSAEDLVFYPASPPWVPGFVGKNAKFRVETVTTSFPDGTGVLSLTQTLVRERSERSDQPAQIAQPLADRPS